MHNEALEQYGAALKAGQRYYKAAVARGSSPYPTVLDELTQGSVANGMADLGHVNVPTELIVGTKSAGRTFALAGNFMPLLPVTSEFGMKWTALCDAHLSEEGIRDPIKCYEYFGRFYVQEGNKRVSVLKSYDAPTIPAIVTRIIPPYSEEEHVRLYYEFMAFYALARFYGVEFRRTGDYARLQAALGFEPDHVWSEDERRRFSSGFSFFKGVYERASRMVTTYTGTEKGTREGVATQISEDDPQLADFIGEDNLQQLQEEIELLDGASAEFDQELVSAGELSPVFFGSALTNFGVEIFLKHFLKMTTPPLPRKSDAGVIDPVSHDFSAFVFKIQANMNKAHRDRIAFMRICSGQFDAGMEVYHVQGDHRQRLSQPQQMMASERHIVQEAYAGDIIGVFDPGIFSIGDTVCMPGQKFAYEGIPTFAPEHFARVRQMDTMKRKQFVKGITQIAQEGAIQIFQELSSGMEEIIVGVVGILQFDVLKYRLENEYNVDIKLEMLPYEHIRWIENEGLDVSRITGTSDMKRIQDLKGRPLLLFVNSWSVQMVLDRNEGLKLSEFGRA